MVETGTMETTNVIEIVQTHQNVIAANQQSLSRKNIRKEPGNKNQRTTGTKITRGNPMIENKKSRKKELIQEEKRGKRICKHRYIKVNLQQNIHLKNIKPRA